MKNLENCINKGIFAEIHYLKGEKLNEKN